MFKNDKILILGMARSGYEVAKLLSDYENEIIVTDAKEQDNERLEELNEEIEENYYLKRSNFHGNMLTYIAKGSGYFSFGGRTYALKEHDLILINCMDEHIMYPNKDGMTIYFMHVDNLSLTDFAIVTDFKLVQYAKA